MKKTIKFLIILMISTICIMINCNIVYANPNSSRGFADYSDEDAEKENEKLVENQKEKIDTTKSNNNYLESLKIEGYELSPEFDKQTLDYKINKPITVDNVNIIAKAFDDKAKISGNGNTKIENNQKEFIINVIAESGSTRTYKISFEKVDEEKKETDEKEIDEKENIVVNDTVEDNKNAIVEVYSQKEEKNKENNNQKLFAIMGIIGIVIVILIIITFITFKKRK